MRVAIRAPYPSLDFPQIKCVYIARVKLLAGHTPSLGGGGASVGVGVVFFFFFYFVINFHADKYQVLVVNLRGGIIVWRVPGLVAGFV